MCPFSLQQLRDDLNVLRREVVPSGEANINLPVNLKRLIWNAKERFQCNNNRSGPTGGGLDCLSSAIMIRRSPADPESRLPTWRG